VIGKVVGIVGFTWLAVKLRAAELPGDVSWRNFTGMGLIAGIGFTVSLFIGDLAFEDEAMVAQAKIAILFASVLAGLLGYCFLRWTNRSALPLA
jgi:NhaA family Na+:H+ antiporter